jgi:hypothetical protein
VPKEVEMLTVKLVAKTAGVSIAALAALVMVVASLAAVGVPPAILAPATWVSFAALGYFKSKDLWSSSKPWAWALAGFFLGIFAFPFFWFCYEHHRAADEEAEIPPEAGRTAEAGMTQAPVHSLPEGATVQSRVMAH